MPAPVLKFVTAFELDLGYGWSEIHYKQSASENPNLALALDNFVTNVLTRAPALLGESAKITNVRVSYPRLDRSPRNRARRKWRSSELNRRRTPRLAGGRLHRRKQHQIQDRPLARILGYGRGQRRVSA